MENNVFEWFHDPDNEAGARIRCWLPQAMENEEGIIQDVKDLKERGFRGIEVVPFRAQLKDESYAWNSERWYRNLEVLIKEAEKEGLRVDIANGPAWPVAMPSIKNADDEAALYELTYGYTIVHEDFDHHLPQRRVIHEEGTSRLIALMAYELVSDHTLKQESYIDLLPYVKDEMIDYDLSNHSDLIIFAFYTQPAVQKVMDRYYVIDHLSLKGAQACEKYWKESLYPIIQKYPGVCESIFCDSLEYKVSLEWTRGLEEIFKEKKGYDLLPYLPLIHLGKTYPKDDTPDFTFEDERISEMISHDYCDVLTDLFIENHLKPLKELAESMHMTLRYQVAYNKPFNIEDCAAAVSIPENETLNRASMNNLAVMNGACHIGNKKIYSYECNAEFMNAYGQTYADLLWWTKRGYVSGINRQVFHGAAYNGSYGNQEYFNWPGYEAFGRFVSNYWNRTLNVEHSKHHMEYIARINALMQKKHIVDLAIYRHDFLNDGKGGDGEYIVHDECELLDHGYSYDFLSPSLLEKGIFPYKALIMNEVKDLSMQCIHTLLRLASEGHRIYFVFDSNINMEFYCEKDQKEALHACLKKLKEYANVKHVSSYPQLIIQMEKDNVYPSVRYTKKEQIASVHTADETAHYYYLYNYNPVESCITKEGKAGFKEETCYPLIRKDKVYREKDLTVQIESEGIPVYMDAESGQLKNIHYQRKSHTVEIPLHFLEEEAIMIALVPQNIYEQLDIQETLCDHFKTVKDDLAWDVTFYELVQDGPLFKDTHYQKIDTSLTMKDCTWWDETDPSLARFTGYAVYRTEFTMNKEDVQYALQLPEICDTFDVEINGTVIQSISQFRKNIDITGPLKDGSNVIIIRVFSNLARMLNEKTNAHYGIHGTIRLLKEEI